MKLIILVFLKTTRMKNVNWKDVLLCIVHLIEMLIAGAAGGMAASL